jgi:hypothetical protein
MEITISKSYSQKVNWGNYETSDFFSARSATIPLNSPQELQEELSDLLFKACYTDVNRSVIEVQKQRGIKSELTKDEVDEFKKMVEQVRKGLPILVEQFEALTPMQLNEVNEAKKEYKRSEEYKNKARVGRPKEENRG